MAPQNRTPLAGNDSEVLSIVLVTFLILAANFRHYSAFFKNFARDLWSTRSRESLFADHTLNETRILVSLILVCIVAEGILVTTAALPCLQLRLSFMILGSIVVMGGYYLFQVIAYRTVAYAFTTEEKALMWLKGFNASQSLLGLTLIVPAVIVLFYPNSAYIILPLAVTLYIIARLIFIIKGFRIFYDNLFSLVYFILYLCTLEICPVVLIVNFFLKRM